MGRLVFYGNGLRASKWGQLASFRAADPGTQSSACPRVPIPFAFRRTDGLTLLRATRRAAPPDRRPEPGLDPAQARSRGRRPRPARGEGPRATAAGRGAGRALRRRGASEGSEGPPPSRLTVDVLPVADVLQVAARVLAAQVGVGPAGLQPRVGIPAELGAGRHAARGGVPHGGRPGPSAAPGQQRRRRRGLAMGGPAPLARPGGLSAAEERPRPRDCGRPARLTPPPPWRAPRSRLRYPVGPAPRRRPQAVPVQGARPLGMRGRGDSGTRGGRGRRERGRPWAVGTLAAERRSARPGRGRPRRRWVRPPRPRPPRPPRSAPPAPPRPLPWKRMRDREGGPPAGAGSAAASRGTGAGKRGACGAWAAGWGPRGGGRGAAPG